MITHRLYIPEWLRLLDWRQSVVARQSKIDIRHLSKLCSQKTRDVHEPTEDLLTKIGKTIGLPPEGFQYNPYDEKNKDLVNKVMNERGPIVEDLAKVLASPLLVYNGKPVTPQLRKAMKALFDSVLEQQISGKETKSVT